jgi:hypothetical protein
VALLHVIEPCVPTKLDEKQLTTLCCVGAVDFIEIRSQLMQDAGDAIHTSKLYQTSLPGSDTTLPMVVTVESYWISLCAICPKNNHCISGGYF